MKKKLFKNYNYEFDKNDRKIITNFCKQAVQQLQSENNSFQDVKTYSAIIEKMNEGTETVKLTKDETKKLSLQLKENVKHIKKTMANSWFLKKWLYKSVLKQYNSLLERHFSD